MRILLWMPTIDGRIPMDMMFYILTMRTKHEIWFCLPSRTPVSLARNLIIQKAIKDKYDYVRWLDDDNVPLTPTMLDDLIDTGEDIVSALVPSRLKHVDGEHKRCVYSYRDPINPVHLQTIPWDKFEIDACGLWCCLMSVKCLEQVSQYYPAPCETSTHKYYWVNGRYIHEDYIHEKGDLLRTHAQVSEDLILLDRLRNLWYKLYARTLFCKHLSHYYVAPNEVPSFNNYTSTQSVAVDWTHTEGDWGKSANA